MMFSTRKPGTYLQKGYMPNESDILCGRGRAVTEHPGNKLFKTFIRSKLKAYSDASSRTAKGVFISTIVDDLLEAGMRFLKFDKDCNRYVELCCDHAYEKVGHAIRDLPRQDKKKKFAVKNEPTEADAKKEATNIIDDELLDEIFSPTSSSNGTNITEHDKSGKLIESPYPLDEKGQGQLLSAGLEAWTADLDSPHNGTQMGDFLASFCDQVISGGEFNEVREKSLGNRSPNFQRDSSLEPSRLFDQHGVDYLRHVPASNQTVFPTCKSKEQNDSPLPVSSTKHFESQDVDTLLDVLDPLYPL